MSRVVFVGPHAALAASLAGASYLGDPPEGAVVEAIEELDVPPARRLYEAAPEDEIVDTSEWNLPAPVGLCLEEVRELRAVVLSRLR
jgi:hypothetical protein